MVIKKLWRCEHCGVFHKLKITATECCQQDRMELKGQVSQKPHITKYTGLLKRIH